MTHQNIVWKQRALNSNQSLKKVKYALLNFIERSGSLDLVRSSFDKWKTMLVLSKQQRIDPAAQDFMKVD